MKVFVLFFAIVAAAGSVEAERDKHADEVRYDKGHLAYKDTGIVGPAPSEEREGHHGYKWNGYNREKKDYGYKDGGKKKSYQYGYRSDKGYRKHYVGRDKVDDDECAFCDDSDRAHLDNGSSPRNKATPKQHLTKANNKPLPKTNLSAKINKDSSVNGAANDLDNEGEGRNGQNNGEANRGTGNNGNNNGRGNVVPKTPIQLFI